MDQSAVEDLRRILRVEVPVIVQLAQRQMSMEEVLGLNVGSVIQFDKPFDAELELIISNRRIGAGHAVKVGENFGLRISTIGSVQDTIRALGQPAAGSAGHKQAAALAGGEFIRRGAD